jgi:hypothetical protein
VQPFWPKYELHFFNFLFSFVFEKRKMGTVLIAEFVNDDFGNDLCMMKEVINAAN